MFIERPFGHFSGKSAIGVAGKGPEGGNLTALTFPVARHRPKPLPDVVSCPPEGFLQIDHLFARMQRLNMYEAKTNAMTRIGSNLSQVLPPPFSCE